MKFYLCDNCHRVVFPPIHYFQNANQDICEECYQELQQLLADALS